MGRAAFFIRTFGCPLHCPWCDSAGTWHPDYVPSNILRVEHSLLAEEAEASNTEFVVVTGGEPCVHDLRPLTRALKERNCKVHLETSGAYPIRGDFDWVTVSPKDSKPVLPECINAASELKLIIECGADIGRWLNVVVPMMPRVGQTPIWLHPEWSQHCNPELLRSISRAVLNFPGIGLRAGWQLHKLYRCDALDNRSAQPVPLGGNPQLGY